MQRVSQASVKVDGRETAAIGTGLLVLLGVRHEDTLEDAAWMGRKLLGLRIFEDATGLMNRSVVDVNGGLIVVSQFTLYGDTRKGNRPSFIAAARPEVAEPLYLEVVAQLRRAVGPERVGTGVFGAHMRVDLVNEGPVTVELRSEAGS